MNKALADLFDRHERVALLISGGKDSLACFYLCRPWWDQVDLVWVDTGKNLPEVRDIIRRCAEEAYGQHASERLTVLRSDQQSFIRVFGHPSDLPVSDSTALGQLVSHHEQRGPRVCDKWECCKKNIWEPISHYMCTMRATAIIKGQKYIDRYVGPSYSLPAKKADGTEIEVCLPVFDWSDDQCRDFVRSNAPSGELLNLEHSSFDCWDCTGYWRGLPGRIEYLKAHHPEKADYLIRLFRAMRTDMGASLSLLDRHLNNFKENTHE